MHGKPSENVLDDWSLPSCDEPALRYVYNGEYADKS